MLKQMSIHEAAQLGDAGVIEALLESTAGLVNATDSDGATPLHIAAREEHVEAVELLLANEADVNAVDGDGRTPLHLAAMNNFDTAVIEALLEFGAEINLGDYAGYTPLYYAQQSGYSDIINSLREHGALDRW